MVKKSTVAFQPSLNTAAEFYTINRKEMYEGINI